MCLHVGLYKGNVLVSTAANRSRKGALYALELELEGNAEPLTGCWEVNLYPLDDQYVPYPQSQFSSLKPLYILRQGLLLN